MRRILVIGIGAGNPDHLTLQAIDAIAASDVFFVVDKGEAKDDLVALRDHLLDTHATRRPYRTVFMPDPPRDRQSPAYREAVEHWHDLRAQMFGAAFLDELADDETGAFLVWGDPSLYDSTLRVLDRVAAQGSVEFRVEVVPGITSVQALAAAHRILLNDIGAPVLITTGRRLADGLPDVGGDVVVMLDASLSCRRLAEPDMVIYWGAYLGMPAQLLRSGHLADVGDEIAEIRARARAEHGWIMDTYLLRRLR